MGVLHVSLTVSSVIYSAVAICKTLYASYLAKEREEKALVEEGVHHVYHTYVKTQKRYGGSWSAAEKSVARDLVIRYVRANSSRMCGCFRSTDKRLVSWIDDEVAEAKSRRAQTLAVSLLQHIGGIRPRADDGAWSAL
jgi:hypothetical protein